MATTPNYSFSVYSSTDTDVRFLDFRVATAGSQSTSNFYVIDTVLKQHSDAIDSINATPSAFVVKGTYSSGSLYTASVANYPGYKNEQLIVLSLNQKNTGAVQININGTTNKDVMKYGSDGVLKAVDAGDFVANSPVLCLYDGTRFVVIGITSASSITVTGEAGDILQIADDGTIESSGKKTAQPNGIATLDENGNVVQVANMANSAAAVYSGEPVTVEYAGANRIDSLTLYGENAQGGTTEAPVALTGVDSVQVCGNNLLPNKAETQTVHGITYTINKDKSVTVKGTSTGSWATLVLANKLSLPTGSYTLAGNGITDDVMLIVAKDTSGTTTVRSAGKDNSVFSITSRRTDLIVYITVKPNTTADMTIYPMLNLGSTILPYEPYQGSLTTLPIPRSLRRVGDVRDVCRTRVKSVYDKRIVIDQNSNISMSGEASIVGTSRRFNVPAEDIPITNDAVIEPVRCNILPARPSGGVSGTYALDAPGISLQNNQSVSQPNINIRVPGCKTLEEVKAWLTDNPLTVYYQSTAYNGTNGLDICLTEYQNGFVELDGTEAWNWNTSGAWAYISTFLLNNKTGIAPACSHYQGTGAVMPAANQVAINEAGSLIIKDPAWQSVDDAKAYIAAQKAAGTPVQIAYQLATAEVYATDPLDIDNAAGPLTVVTGGQVEVKMTDFVTDRTPAFLNKLDKTGDGSDVTVTFTEAATDTDIASGDKLSILFGKILKRFSTITSKFTTVDNSITQIESDISDITDGTTVVAQANKVTNALVIMSNSGTALVNYDGSATANMTLSPSNVGAEPAFTKNTAFNKNFGSSAGTVCQGNDGRLSDARRSSNISMSLSGTNLSISYS